jgi:hypothetical protein
MEINIVLSAPYQLQGGTDVLNLATFPFLPEASLDLFLEVLQSSIETFDYCAMPSLNFSKPNRKSSHFTLIEHTYPSPFGFERRAISCGAF